MVEGSRRLSAIRQLAKEKPPKGVSYTKILANVYPKDTDEKTVHVQKLILQTGKNPWGPFNVSKAIYDLVNNDNFTPQEVSIRAKKSVSSINKELQNYKIYKEFLKWTKKQGITTSPKQYTYFQRASMDVRDKLFISKPQREKFYKVITPNKKGITRIPNVSTAGGLMQTLNKFAVNENILQEFLKNPKMEATDALLKFKGGDIKHEFPWTKKLKEVSTGLNKLSSEDLKKIKKEKAVYNMLVKISLATTKIVEKK